MIAHASCHRPQHSMELSMTDGARSQPKLIASAALPDGTTLRQGACTPGHVQMLRTKASKKPKANIADSSLTLSRPRRPSLIARTF